MKKIIIILLLFLTTGCFNQREINDIMITTILGIDYKDNTYYVNAGILNFKDEKESMIIISSKGNSIIEAISNMINIYPKDMYLSHLKLLLLNENTLKSKSLDSINYLISDPKVGLNFYVAATKEDTKDIMKVITPDSSYNTSTIYEGLVTNFKYNSTSRLVTFDTFIKDVITNKESILLPIIEIDNNNLESENKKEKLFKITKSIIMNNKNEINYLDENDTVAYNIIKSNGNSANSSDECFNTHLKSIKSDIKYKDNIFYFNIKLTSNITELKCNLELNDETNKMIINKTNNNINNMISSLIEKSKLYKTDFLGLSNIIYCNDYKLFNNIKNFENDYLPNIKYVININNELIKSSNIRNKLERNDSNE